MENAGTHNLLRERGFHSADSSIFEKLAYAVASLHKKSILHGDLKPANLMMKKDGQVKIIDLGNSVALEKGTGYPGDITTRSYRPPEAVFARYSGFKTDVYSLGCIFFELITGTPFIPFKLFAKGGTIQGDVDHLHAWGYRYGKLSAIPERFLNIDPTSKEASLKKSSYQFKDEEMLPLEDLLNKYMSPGPSTEKEAQLISLVKEMVQWDPEERFSMEEVLSQPYFSVSASPSDHLASQEEEEDIPLSSLSLGARRASPRKKEGKSKK